MAPNRLDQQVRVDEPNKIWCGDITYLWTLEGWLYLAVIIDLYSRKVVGWALDRQLKTSLVLEALRMAYWRQKPAPGVDFIIPIGALNMPPGTINANWKFST